MDDLEGKVAVVTGAASGIGRALADRWADSGMKVVLADVEEGPLDVARDELDAAGADVLAVRTDVSDGDQVDALAAATLDHFGAVHLVCNNAGVGGGGLSWEASREDWDWVLGVNLWGVIHGVRAFVPHLVAQDEGHVVNTASIAGFAYGPMMGPYNASKAAVVAISETLKADLALQGSEVGVSVLCPGWVNTRIHESDRNRPGGPETGGLLAEGREVMAQVLANGKQPDEVAHLVAAAVREGTTHIFTGDEWIGLARGRMETVLAELPGERVLTEVPPDPIPPTIEWSGDRVRLIDQRLLPGRFEVVEATTVPELCELISTLAIRGAPALGAAGAMGVALAHVRGEDTAAAADALIATRPTAVNLAWGARRALAAADPAVEAETIAADDVERCRAIGRHGAALVPEDGRVLTHCNAGGLACVGYGTALGVIRGAQEAGRRPRVWVDETRPVLQGARLTAWELGRLGIEHTLVVDAVAGSLMADGLVDLVVLGADRIAANGDVANKIGTYSLAVLAHHHGVPFYVAAPRSTFDPDCPSGADIVVELRDPDEVTVVAGSRVAPEGVTVANRAFDVTPAALVTGYVMEDGVHARP